MAASPQISAPADRHWWAYRFNSGRWYTGANGDLHAWRRKSEALYDTAVVFGGRVVKVRLEVIG